MIRLRLDLVTQFQVTSRTFCTTLSRNRNKSEIYNADDRPTPVLEESFREKLQNGFKAKKRIPYISPSEDFTKNVIKLFDKAYASHKDHLKRYSEAGVKLSSFIKHRKVPLEKGEIEARKQKVEDRLKEEFSVEAIDRDENPDPKIMKRLKHLESSTGCKWAPIEFDETASLTYLVTNSAREFASLVNIFNIIKDQDENYKPRSLFDFGSGVCTGLWAAREVFGHFSEAFMVDSSTAMNDIARSVIDGHSSSKDVLPSITSFRLQIPSTVALKYELVLCSHTLLELPSAAERLATLNKLWNRVEKGGYLVLAESGTNAGFHVIAEARDYLVQISQLAEAEAGEAEAGAAGGEGHSVAPCSHEAACPRHAHDTIPCNFPVKYQNFDIADLEPATLRSDVVSYFVFKKEARSRAGRPRLVEAPLKAGTCVYCRLCTAGGRLQEVLVRKNRDKDLYNHAIRLRCGDTMPVSLKKEEDQTKIGTPWMKQENIGLKN